MCHHQAFVNRTEIIFLKIDRAKGMSMFMERASHCRKIFYRSSSPLDLPFSLEGVGVVDLAGAVSLRGSALRGVSVRVGAVSRRGSALRGASVRVGAVSLRGSVLRGVSVRVGVVSRRGSALRGASTGCCVRGSVVRGAVSRRGASTGCCVRGSVVRGAASRRGSLVLGSPGRLSAGAGSGRRSVRRGYLVVF